MRSIRCQLSHARQDTDVGQPAKWPKAMLVGMRSWTKGVLKKRVLGELESLILTQGFKRLKDA